DGEKEATLRFGKYSESDSHPVRIYLSNNNTPGWHKLRITAQGTSAAGVIKSCNTGESVFPEATIREKPSTPVPLVFQGANLRLRNIKIRPINTKPVEKALQELLKRKSSSAAVVLFENSAGRTVAFWPLSESTLLLGIPLKGLKERERERLDRFVAKLAE